MTRESTRQNQPCEKQGKEYGAHAAHDWKPLESFQWEESHNLILPGLFWLLGR